jgi:hypothetical protein
VLTALTLAAFGVTMIISPVREFYELETMDLADGLIVAVGVSAWLIALGACWALLSRVQQRLASRNRHPQ